MDGLYTRCPHCQTVFRLSEQHLAAANGRVRCGACFQVFDAVNHRVRPVQKRSPELNRPAPAAGLSGASRYDLQHGSVVYDALFEGLGSMLLGNPFFDGAELDRAAMQEAKEAWLARLRANNLATLRTATGYADATWRFRLFW